jgi:hypothetical protein
MIVGAGWRPSIRPTPGCWASPRTRPPSWATSSRRPIPPGPTTRSAAATWSRPLNANWMLHMATLESGDHRRRPGRAAVEARPRLGLPHLPPAGRRRPSVQPAAARRHADTLSGGIENDADGAPAVYHIRNAHPGDWGIRHRVADTYTWTPVSRYTASHPGGPALRPQVLHLFRRDRPGQTRGVSRLVAALGRFKQMARFAQAELANAVINALFAATITSSFDPAIAQHHLTGSAVAGYPRPAQRLLFGQPADARGRAHPAPVPRR